MIGEWLKEVKQRANPKDLGMILVHHGIVRGISKSGRPVHRMKLSYDQKRLNSVIPIFKQRTGVVAVRVWINSGNLKVGDDIMLLLVAGRIKPTSSPYFKNDLL